MSQAPLALVVDDDPTLRMLVGRSARRAGFDLVEARDLPSLEQALTGPTPALVILDLTLGRLPPEALLARLSGIGCTVPLLPLTGWTGPETSRLLDTWRSRGLTLLPMITKPVHLDTLAAVLARYRP